MSSRTQQKPHNRCFLPKCEWKSDSLASDASVACFGMLQYVSLKSFRSIAVTESQTNSPKTSACPFQTVSYLVVYLHVWVV